MLDALRHVFYNATRTTKKAAHLRERGDEVSHASLLAVRKAIASDADVVLTRQLHECCRGARERQHRLVIGGAPRERLVSWVHLLVPCVAWADFVSNIPLGPERKQSEPSEKILCSCAITNREPRAVGLATCMCQICG